jgi:hypothetical protein
MTLPGAGFIALWNDIAAGRDDYDTWHTTEHVPQRLGVEGFLGARRYVRCAGSLPHYLTLYALADLDVLDSDAYRGLIRAPTVWTESMRPDFRNFSRVVCRTAATAGQGVGGYGAVRRTSKAGREEVLALCEELLALDGISGVHFGEVDSSASGLDLKLNSAPAVEGAAGVLLVEGYEEEKLRRSCETLDLGRRTGIVMPLDWTFYKLAFALRREDIFSRGSGVERNVSRPSPRPMTAIKG